MITSYFRVTKPSPNFHLLFLKISVIHLKIIPLIFYFFVLVLEMVSEKIEKGKRKDF